MSISFAPAGMAHVAPVFGAGTLKIGNGRDKRSIRDQLADMLNQRVKVTQKHGIQGGGDEFLEGKLTAFEYRNSAWFFRVVCDTQTTWEGVSKQRGATVDLSNTTFAMSIILFTEGLDADDDAAAMDAAPANVNGYQFGNGVDNAVGNVVGGVGGGVGGGNPGFAGRNTPASSQGSSVLHAPQGAEAIALPGGRAPSARNAAGALALPGGRSPSARQAAGALALPGGGGGAPSVLPGSDLTAAEDFERGLTQSQSIAYQAIADKDAMIAKLQRDLGTCQKSFEAGRGQYDAKKQELTALRTAADAAAAAAAEKIAQLRAAAEAPGDDRGDFNAGVVAGRNEFLRVAVAQVNHHVAQMQALSNPANSIVTRIQTLAAKCQRDRTNVTPTELNALLYPEYA